MAVTQQELDALVRRIGDELLAQVGDSPLKSRLDEVSSWRLRAAREVQRSPGAAA